MANNAIGQPADSGYPMDDAKIVIKIPEVPRDYKARVDWMNNRQRGALSRFAIASKKAGGLPVRDEKARIFLEKSEQYLDFLEYDPSFRMTPQLKRDASIEATFDLILHKPGYCFPNQFKKRAQRIYDSWVAINWGAGAEEDAEESEEVGSSTGTSTRAVVAEDAQATIQYPPRNHPIWGIDGIMHGLARVVRQNGRTSMVLDQRYPKKTSNVYGHNNLEPGRWFPFQLAALFNGAHGSRQAGIHGDHQHGAYSIVISSKYHHLDRDAGTTIFYSGAGSDENTDPDRVNPGKQDATLVASIRSRQPVRVLRASNKTNHYAPSVGIRYDGLYQVVRQEQPRKNTKGGLYRRLVLERLPDQPDLQDIISAAPDPQQRRQFEKIGEGF